MGDRIIDCVVLGGGPGGYSCALRLADLGLTVQVVEADRVGGTCLHRGCIPTRSMLQAASVADAAAHEGARWGLATRFDGVDMTALRAARDHVVDVNHRAITSHLAAGRVEVVRGKGWLAGPRTVVVDGRRLEARRAVVLATGSTPRIDPAVVPDGTRILTSDQALALEELPRSALILGGGAVGAEFSQVFAALGVRVTLVELRDRLVPMEDADVGRELRRALRHRGIEVHTGLRAVGVDLGGPVPAVTFLGAGAPTTLQADVVISAVGRSPATAGMGLAEVGVVLDDEGFVVPVDWATLETHVGGVHVVGDLLPPPSLPRANAAYAEGQAVADAIAGQPSGPIDYHATPRVTHGLTETACVGLSEQDARARYDDVEVRRAPLAATAKGLMVGGSGMTKVVARRDGPVLGVHLVGPHVTEVIGEGAAITGFEATAAEAAWIRHSHPTLAEGLGEVVGALAGRALHVR